jgi:hypothetical protein
MHMVLLLGFIAAFSPAQAQEPRHAASHEPSEQRGRRELSAPRKVLTGKERLGEKWTDEQRVDNCKVPLDKRGSRLRPDACQSAAPQ